MARHRATVLGNIVMAGEIPSPTGGERKVVEFLYNRFIEAGLNHVTIDEAGNAGAVLPGNSDRNILVAAHVDKIWSKTVEHRITALENAITGPGVADNALGVAILASLPRILEILDVTFDANLILVGTTGSLGPGNLGGMRFFLENTREPIHAGICLEGMDLGRLSYSSLGMVRAEITVKLDTESDWPWHGVGTGAIGPLSKIVDCILGIDRPEKPRTTILLGSIQSGSGYNFPPSSGVLKFEIRSESEDVVDRIYHQIEEIVEETSVRDDCDTSLSVLARRKSGDIGFRHPFVRAIREIMESLEIKPRIAPSISELSALLDHGIPGLTLGITKGDHRSTREESIVIEDIFTGIAQIVSTLEFIDHYLKES